MSIKRFQPMMLAVAIGVVALLVAACSQPTPAPAPSGPTAEEIRAIVQQEVANAPAPAPVAMPAPAPAGPSAEEIAAMVQQAVADAVPEGTDSAEISRMVEQAVMSAQADAVSGDDIEKLVSNAVMEASDSQTEPLSASEVEAIVAAAVAAIPTPEPVVIPPQPPMMMMGPTGDPINIGTLFDYTGELGIYGPPIRNGADIAAEIINDAGGILGRPVRAVHKDGGTSPQVTTDAARALATTEGAQAIVGALASGSTIAAANAVTIPNEVVLISPASTSPAISVLEDNDYVFRTAVFDGVQGIILADLANELGYKTAAALYVNNPYGEGLADVFKENFERLGGKVTALVPHEQNQVNYLSELETAVEGDPDVLIAISYPVSTEVYVREAVEGEYADTFLFVDANKSQELIDSINDSVGGPAALSGMHGTAPGAVETDETAIFRILYEARYGEVGVQPFIGEGFDAFMIAALATEHAGAYESSAIRDSIRAVANPPGIKVGPGDIAKALELIRGGHDIDYEGVAGEQNFDDNGDVLGTIEIWKIDENGQIAHVEYK